MLSRVVRPGVAAVAALVVGVSAVMVPVQANAQAQSVVGSSTVGEDTTVAGGAAGVEGEAPALGSAVAGDTSQCGPILAGIGALATVGLIAHAAGPGLAQATAGLQEFAAQQAYRVQGALGIPQVDIQFAGIDQVQAGLQDVAGSLGPVLAGGAGLLALVLAAQACLPDAAGSSTVGSSRPNDDQGQPGLGGDVAIRPDAGRDDAYVGENGNWWLGESDLGLRAPERVESPSQEESDAVAEIVQQVQGQKPYVGENGNWWAGNSDLGLRAPAPELEEPAPAQPVVTPVVVPHVGPNGNWWVGETDLGVKVPSSESGSDAQNVTTQTSTNQNTTIIQGGLDGRDGEDGKDGASMLIELENVAPQMQRCEMQADTGGLAIKTYRDKNHDGVIDEGDELVQEEFAPSLHTLSYAQWQEYVAANPDQAGDYIVMDVAPYAQAPISLPAVFYVGHFPVEVREQAWEEVETLFDGVREELEADPSEVEYLEEDYGLPLEEVIALEKKIAFLYALRDLTVYDDATDRRIMSPEFCGGSAVVNAEFVYEWNENPHQEASDNVIN